MTQPEAIAWINQSVGKRYDTDGYYGAQCKDLANAYANWFGHPLKASNAGPTWTLAQDPFWQKLANTATFVPQGGDIAIWGGNPGHISLVLNGATTSKFTSVDQNWFNANSTVGSPAAVVTHNYTDVVGFLRPQYTTNSAPAPIGGNTMSKVDLGIARILAHGVGGRLTAHSGDSDADLNANHVGQETNGDVYGWFNSTEGKNWREQRLPQLLARAAETDQLRAQLDTLTATVNDLNKRPTQAQLDELKKQADDSAKAATDARVEAEKAQAEAERLAKQATQDTKQLDDASGFLKGLVEFIKSLLSRNK